MKVYRIKSITNFKNESIEHRENWLDLYVTISELEIGQRATLPEFDLINDCFILKFPYKEISTSAVQGIKEIDEDILIATYSGSLYLLERIK